MMAPRPIVAVALIGVAMFSIGGCSIVVEQWALEKASHVPVGTDITWTSNPPSSGSHFPVWAAYQAFSTPVPRGYYVHDLEHGAVVLLFNCARSDAGCDELPAALQQVSDALPSDGMCTAPVRVRTVISPDPLLPTPIAAVAWGFVYRAECVDLPSLKAFAAAHYAQGPENVCANGVTQF